MPSQGPKYRIHGVGRPCNPLSIPYSILFKRPYNLLRDGIRAWNLIGPLGCLGHTCQTPSICWGPFAGVVACCGVVMAQVLRGVEDMCEAAYGFGAGTLWGDHW
jgi:hypothetical protein